MDFVLTKTGVAQALQNFASALSSLSHCLQEIVGSATKGAAQLVQKLSPFSIGILHFLQNIFALLSMVINHVPFAIL